MGVRRWAWPEDWLNKQQMNCFHNITNPVGIDGVVNEFAIPLGFDNASPAEDRQVLGCNGLFQAKVNV